MKLFKKLFSTKKSKPLSHAEEMEVCVHCGVLTSVSTSTPVENRTDFVSGCGQLCPECYIKFCSGTLDDEDTRLINAVLDKTQK